MTTTSRPAKVGDEVGNRLGAGVGPEVGATEVGFRVGSEGVGAEVGAGVCGAEVNKINNK